MTTTPAPRIRGRFARKTEVEPEVDGVELHDALYGADEPESEPDDEDDEDDDDDDDDAEPEPEPEPEDDDDDDAEPEPEPEPPPEPPLARYEARERPEPERPFHDTTARVATYRVQIRVDQPGPALKDKRRGWIAIQGRNAPYEVARWLQSADCCRPEPRSGKRVFVWLDDTQVRDSSGEPIVADGDEEDSALVLRAPSGPPMPVLTDGALQTTALIHQRLEVLTAGATRELELAREHYHREMNRLQAKLEAEERKVEAAIEASKARMLLQLAREDEQEEQVEERREKATEQRKKLAASIERDVDTYDDIREKLQAAVKPPAPTTASQTETIVAGIKQVVEIPVVSEVLGGFTMFFMKRLGVPVPE